MSENTKTINESVETGMNAWRNVGEVVARANSLGAREFEAYLNWAKNVQRDFLEYTWFTFRQVTKLQEDQLALFQRIRETTPVLGTTPKGTETIAGMVDEIVNQTRRA